MKQLYTAATASCLGMVSVGLIFGWASPSAPRLIKNDSSVVLTSEQMSWVASLSTFGAIFGSVACALFVNIIGRKRAMLFAAIPSIISWLMIAFAGTFWELCVSRFLSGICIGMAYAVTAIYLGEISPANVRGILTAMLTVAAKFGVLIEYSIGPFLSVKCLAWVSLLAPLLFVSTFPWIPETPYHLLRTGNYPKAVESLKKLRGTKDVSQEIEEIERSVQTDLTNETGFKEILFVAGNRRALTACLGLILVQQFSGSQAIVAYAEMIFDEADNGLEGKYLTIILGIVQVTVTIICASIVDRGGRKPLLILSTLGAAFSMATIAIYFHLRICQVDVSKIAFLPAVGAITYVVMYCFGLAALPFTMIGELFPTNVKALGSTLSMIFCNLGSFIVTKFYPTIADYFGVHYAFWCFTLFSVCGMVFVISYVPETKGKTLQIIQLELQGRKKS